MRNHLKFHWSLLIFGILIFYFNGPSFSQVEFKGKIKDLNTGEGVISATIIYGEGKGVVSDIYGDFSIKDATYPLRLEISHLSYKPRIITVRKALSGPMVIKLEPSEVNVDEVEIVGEKLKRFFERRYFYIIDYSFLSDYIAIIGYDQSRLNYGKILLTNLSQDTISVLPINKPKKLFKDGFGNIHLFAGDSVYQLAVLENRLKLLYPIHEEDLYPDLEQLKIADKHSFIFKDIYGDGQMHQYTLIDTLKRTTDTLIQVYDRKLFPISKVAERHKKSKLRKLDIDYQGQMGKGPGVRAANNLFTSTHFRNNVLYKPITSQVFKHKDEYVILDVPNSEIHAINTGSLEERSIRMDIPTHTKRIKYFVQDEVTGKIYWVYYQGSRALLGELDTSSGKIVDNLETPSLPHIENIKIRNGVVWFLYQARLGEDVRSLYRMR